MGRYYAVSKGNKIGIFTDVKYAQYQTRNTKGSKAKMFKTLDEAKDYILNDNSELSSNDIKIYEVKKYYAIAVGQKIGIFVTEEDMKKYSYGVPNIKLKSFKDLTFAKNYLLSYNEDLTAKDIVIYDENLKGSYFNDIVVYNVAVLKKNGQPSEITSSLKGKVYNKDCKNAVYNFKRKEEAIEFVESLNLLLEEKKGTLKELLDIEKATFEDDIIYVFTDGSYNDKQRIIGYSAVFVKNREIILQISESNIYEFDDNRGSIVAEFKATLMAIEESIAHNFYNICICHDYEGIKYHALGSSKANNIHSQEYGEFMTKYSGVIEFTFKKIDAHKENEWNNLADYLAKKEAQLTA